MISTDADSNLNIEKPSNVISSDSRTNSIPGTPTMPTPSCPELKPEVKSDVDFEPIILAFSCNWCSYTSADLAGVNRFFYPANVRVIRFMCSGRIEPDFIMRAFETGADGIIVSGCIIGECHYISGNEKAQKRLETTGKLLDLLGLGAERLGSVWISAAEGAKFASYMNEFVEKIRKLGPSKSKTE
jgi:coenzyme F420-reducing hydrogenase delta subunit